MNNPIAIRSEGKDQRDVSDSRTRHRNDYHRHRHPVFLEGIDIGISIAR